MSDSQWALVASLLPPPGNTAGKGGRPEKHPRRIVLDAIFYAGRDPLPTAAKPWAWFHGEEQPADEYLYPGSLR